MSEVTDDILAEFRMTADEVIALFFVFLEQVRKSRFSDPLSPIKIAALSEHCIAVLREALNEEEEHAPYLEAGRKVAQALRSIGGELINVGPDEGDRCWALVKGMEELLKKAGLVPREEKDTVSEAEVSNSQRSLLASRAGIAISDIAASMMKLMEPHQAAELTLLRRIEALTGVIISAVDEHHTDMQYLEEQLFDAP